MRFSLFNAHPDTTTFVVLSDAHEVVVTATIIPDSDLGLPMDSIYKAELDRLRKTKKKLCEVGMLAMDSDFFATKYSGAKVKRWLFLFLFFKILYEYVKEYMHFDIMCIAVNPKHKDVYKELLFKDLGEMRRYPGVNHAPALGKYVNVRLVKKGFSEPGKEKLHEIFCNESADPKRFGAKFQLTAADLDYFFKEKSDVFKKASPSKVAYIKKLLKDAVK